MNDLIPVIWVGENNSVLATAFLLFFVGFFLSSISPKSEDLKVLFQWHMKQLFNMLLEIRISCWTSWFKLI